MVEKLRHEIDEVDWNNSESVINFYEANKLYFDRFIKTWNTKNLLQVDGNKFKFTKAVKLFFTFAIEIAEGKLKEKQES